MGFTTTLANAAIKVADKFSSAKATIVIAGEKPEQIPVQFNPSEYRISERTQFTEKTRRKKDEPVVDFNGRPLASLSVKLYFDADEITSVTSVASGAVNTLLGNDDSKDITKKINKITSLTIIDGKSHQPPGAAFVWGALQFLGYVESVSTSYTMFDNKGKPLRAVMDLSMKGMNGPSSEKKSPFMSPDRTKARVMTEDNNIWNIAQKEYGDVREWRRIADANGIMNPLDIPIGKVLRVPSIDD
ncbi:MAG: hypothetical protein K5876_07745 [Ruminiclostridium sp.]|nr:hypothetical protein [Ruminiclostridium sp.]